MFRTEMHRIPSCIDIRDAKPETNQGMTWPEQEWEVWNGIQICFGNVHGCYYDIVQLSKRIMRGE